MTPAFANASRVASRSIATLSLTLQLRHQSAVNHTNTGLPVLRAASRRACENGFASIKAVSDRADCGGSYASASPNASTMAAIIPATEVKRSDLVPARCPLPNAASDATTAALMPMARNAYSAPASRHISHASAAAVSPMGMAMIWRKRAIHGPGAGSRRRTAGMKPTARNGSARPRPSAANSAMASTGGNSSAAPSAAAMNGPVHGVATTAARTPVANALAGSPLRVTDTDGSSNIPARLAVMAAASTSRPTTTPGSCNWNAQPTCSPAARSASTSPPSAVHARMTPAL